MSFSVLNTMMLFLSLLIVETVIASSANFSIKNIENLLLQTALESMNDYSPNNHSYQSGTLLDARKIPTDDDLPILKVSVLLDPDCTEESLCSREICDMLIKQDESNNIIVDDQSKECRYDKNKLNFNHVDVKREVSKDNINDSIIKNFVKSQRFKRATTNKFITRIMNVSKTNVSNIVEYTITFALIGPTCSETCCTINKNSSIKICQIIIQDQNDMKVRPTHISSTCDSPNIYVN